MMKRALSLILSFCMILGMLPMSAFASEIETEHTPQLLSAEELASGYCGYTTWSMRSDGSLVFSGDGAIKNYDNQTATPWYPFADQITTVVMEEGITSVGAYSFYGLKNLVSVEFADTVKSIGAYSFRNCTALETVLLPSGITKMGESAFYGCTALKSINIPESLWTIQPYTFKNCTALESVIFVEGNLQKISNGALNRRKM